MATTSNPTLIPGLEADADLSAKQFHFMKYSADGQAAACSVAGELAIGVLQNDPDLAGKAADVAALGSGDLIKVTAGAAVTIGDKLQTDANGRAIAALTGDHVLGVAQSAAAANGVVFEMLLINPPVLA